VGIERLDATERHGNGADGEVALRQIGLDCLAAQRGYVYLPAVVGGHRAPGGELSGKLERVTAALASDRLGYRRRVASDGEIEVDDVASQGRVANRAAGNPDRILFADRSARQLDQRCGGKTFADRTHTASRGTLAEIPQVTS